jgi:tripartite-type tricarboxylate transporter receptor subunit TctC
MAVAPAAAETCPDGVLRIVVPYPPGGAVDATGRVLAQALEQELGQSAIVDNRTGAAGMVGANYVANATPDGCTLLSTASIHIITPLINHNVPYDVNEDFTPISEIATNPLLVVANKDFPANTLQEMLDYAKKHPGEVTFATSSYGSAGHLASEALQIAGGVDIPVIPYKGSGPALTALIGGEVDLMVDPILSSLPFVKSGELKALAITSTERSAIAKDIPTVGEAGIPGFNFYSWYGVWGPKGMSADAVSGLEAAIVKAIAKPEVQKSLSAKGVDPVGSTAKEFADYIKSETAKYTKIVEEAHITQK